MISTTRPAALEDVMRTAVDSLTVCAGASQEVLRELADWSESAAAEGARLHGELSASAVRTARDLFDIVAGSWRQHGAPLDGPFDAPFFPTAPFREALREMLAIGRLTEHAMRSNVQVLNDAVERLHSSAHRTGGDLNRIGARVVRRLVAPSHATPVAVDLTATLTPATLLAPVAVAAPPPSVVPPAPEPEVTVTPRVVEVKAKAEARPPAVARTPRTAARPASPRAKRKSR